MTKNYVATGFDGFRHVEKKDFIVKKLAFLPLDRRHIRVALYLVGELVLRDGEEVPEYKEVVLHHRRGERNRGEEDFE